MARAQRHRTGRVNVMGIYTKLSRRYRNLYLFHREGRDCHDVISLVDVLVGAKVLSPDEERRWRGYQRNHASCIAEGLDE